MTARELARWSFVAIVAAATSGCGAGDDGTGCGSERSRLVAIDDATFNRLAAQGVAEGECDELCGRNNRGCAVAVDERGGPAVSCRYLNDCPD